MAMVWASALPRDQKYITLALADFGNDDGEGIYPSQAYLCWKTGYSETQLKKIIASLKRSGVVSVDPLGSRYGTNNYCINLSRLPVREPYRGNKTDKPGVENRPTEGLKPTPTGSKTDPIGVENRPRIISIHELNREYTLPHSGETEPAQKRRKSTAKALNQGYEDNVVLRATLNGLFRIDPKFNTKASRDFLDWYHQKPKSQTLDQFAAWWYAQDWRGKQGQPPSLKQIQELWLQAFPPETERQPDREEIIRRIESFQNGQSSAIHGTP